MLLLVEDMLLLRVLQESLILLGSIHFLELLTLLLKTHTHTDRKLQNHSVIQVKYRDELLVKVQ